ncbi:MAG: hypothetical protein IJY39_01485 [Clostridia bacterium]|nr:hypothetical protein [Clostridia bacterium]
MNRDNLNDYREDIKLIKETMVNTKVNYNHLSVFFILYGFAFFAWCLIREIYYFFMVSIRPTLVDRYITAKQLEGFETFFKIFSNIAWCIILVVCIAYWVKKVREVRQGNDKLTLKILYLWGFILFGFPFIQIITDGVVRIISKIINNGENVRNDALTFVSTGTSVAILFLTLFAFLITAILLENKSLLVISIIVFAVSYMLIYFLTVFERYNYDDAIYLVTTRHIIANIQKGVRLSEILVDLFIGITGLCFLPKNIRKYGVE